MTMDSSFGDTFLLGVNYWPAEAGVHFWKEFDPAAVARDFARIRSWGLNCVRLFLVWEDFQPEPGRVNEEAFKNLGEVLRMAAECGLGLIITLFTGHMSGENFDVPWRAGRSPYTDPSMLKAQVFFVRELAGRYRGHPAILAWDLANEHDNYALPESSEAAWLWAHLLTRELQLLDPQTPVIQGIHVTSLSRRDTFRPADLGALHPVLCAHPYPLYTPLCPGPLDRPPSTYFPAFCLKLLAGLGQRPVLLEEFGTTTLISGEEEAAGFFRRTLFSSLINGAVGALAWCYSDLARSDRIPYETVPHEAGFGLIRADGRLKASGQAMVAFANLLRSFPFGSVAAEKPRAAIIMPWAYFTHPEIEPEESMGRLFAAFSLARLAGFDVDFVFPDADFTPYRLLLCPAATARGYLKTSHWRRLEAFVRAGGVLYLSYAGLAVEGLAETFGVQLVGREVRKGEIVLRQEGGPDLSLGPARFPSLRIRPVEAKVLAVEAGGPPIFCRHSLGKGRAFLLTYPLEAGLAGRGELHPAFSLYRHLAREAGLVEGEDDWQPCLTETRLFLPEAAEEREARAGWLVAVNHGQSAATVPLPGRVVGGKVTDLVSGEKLGRLSWVVLGPGQGGIWHIKP
ncbi:MAG: hypothetical protein D9V47_04075 [Clostridia bacterium]|nr:MAG: hypothetical protein D9V47_04075 [Clostridia bacterium]